MIIDGEKLRFRLFGDRRELTGEMGVFESYFYQQMEQCQIPIVPSSPQVLQSSGQVKSPAEVLRDSARVERVIKWLELEGGDMIDTNSMIDLIHFLRGMEQDTWSEEDFKEEKEKL